METQFNRGPARRRGPDRLIELPPEGCQPIFSFQAVMTKCVSGMVAEQFPPFATANRLCVVVTLPATCWPANTLFVLPVAETEPAYRIVVGEVHCQRMLATDVPMPAGSVHVNVPEPPSVVEEIVWQFTAVEVVNFAVSVPALTTVPAVGRCRCRQLELLRTLARNNRPLWSPTPLFVNVDTARRTGCSSCGR